MVDMSQKTLIISGYTFKELRSAVLNAPEDRMSHSDKDIYGKRRVKYSPDPNSNLTITVPTGTEDEKFLLNMAERGTKGTGYFKDTSVDEYKRGVTINEIGVNKGDLTNDNESDSREFTLICVGITEVLI